MTPREARRARREAERKAKKAEKKSRLAQAALPSPNHPIPENATRAEINRLNAQHSTGPKTPEGKLVSSRNSLKHGLASGQILIPGEDPAAFEALLRDLSEEHRPATPTEELLVREMAQSYWLTQRAIRLQNECFTEDGIDEKRLSLLLRYQTTHDRAFHKAVTTLTKLQNRAHKQPGHSDRFVSQTGILAPTASGFVSHPDRHTAPQTHPRTPSDSAEIGFVPQNDAKRTLQAA